MDHLQSRPEDSRVQRQNAQGEKNAETTIRKEKKKRREKNAETAVTKTMIERASETEKKNKRKWWRDPKVQG